MPSKPKKRPTVAELQSFLPPPSLEDRLRALVVVWRGRANIYQAEGERLRRFIVNRMNAFARRDEWLQASRDLEAILDAFAKEQGVRSSGPAVTVTEIMRPIYNFKAGADEQGGTPVRPDDAQDIAPGQKRRKRGRDRG